ncbi:MAG: FAD-dependent oxidoreductase [Candidatus Aminicenantes bacterium]|nr:FAD-dependent oxidoreductase [Candidatus Aminicenantes bacterium]
MSARENSCDVLIIGGGIIGCAAACFLLNADKNLKVTVAEKDLTYSQASTPLSLANVRIQFSLKQNIEISQYTQAFIKEFPEKMEVDGDKPDLCFRKEGNIFLINSKNKDRALKDLELQKEMGCRVDWLEPFGIESKFPLYSAHSAAGGTWSPDDGYLDPHSFLNGFRKKAGSLGAHMIEDRAVKLIKSKKRIQGARLQSGKIISSLCVVNAAGAWASELAETASVSLPINPIKRQVFALEPAEKPDSPLPLTILPSGLYFRTETGDKILSGRSFADDPEGFDFSWDPEVFRERLWPELAEFVPSFDRLRIKRGWAGLYAVNTLDENAVLGEWPELKGFFLANGFSGHGLQQAPAVGRSLSELILGKKPVLDLSIFTPQRILESRPILESAII